MRNRVTSPFSNRRKSSNEKTHDDSQLHLLQTITGITVVVMNLTVSLHVVLSRHETCDNDDDFTTGWREELPPGVQGCRRPKPPDNSFLRVKAIIFMHTPFFSGVCHISGCLLRYICTFSTPNLSMFRVQKAKQYYNFGEDEEFQCFTGFELEGFQFINCLPDGTWSQSKGSCLSGFWILGISCHVMIWLSS